MSEEAVGARMKRIQQAMRLVEPRPDPVKELGSQGRSENIKRLGYLHEVFKYASDLHGPAKRFYEVVAEMAGLALTDLVRAVFVVERLVMDWEAEERRRRAGWAEATEYPGILKEG